MSADALLKWKSQIWDYQQRVRENKPPEQTALFDIAPNHCNPDRIDPLRLEVRRLAKTVGIALVLEKASR